jgi:hypothetical protein
MMRPQPAPLRSLDVTSVEGRPTVQSRPIAERGALPEGGWLATDAASRALVDVGGTGRVEVEPGSRLGLLRAEPGDYRLHLSRGTVHAVIWSPPGEFAVTTPTSTAVDLGCIYKMTVEEDGTGFLEVAAGWVGFTWKGRESFIPAGAVCVTRPGLGPGTPHYEDTSPAFRAALATIDVATAPAEARARALTLVLDEARRADVLTLWHLLTRVAAEDRDRVYDRLAAFVPPPAGVTRDGIRNGARPMLDAWWDALDLGTSAWWRVWIQQWRDPAPRR